MKKLSLYAFLVLGLLFLNNCSFRSSTYLKCEPYNNPIEIFYYFAFNQSYIWSNYDPENSKFKKKSDAQYGERYVKADNITINRASGTIRIKPSLWSDFLDVLAKTKTNTIVLNCEEINRKELPKEERKELPKEEVDQKS